MTSTRPTTSPWTTGKTLALALLLAAALALTLAAGTAEAVPETFTVTTTDDSGADSLRDAIEDANTNSNPTEQDTIEFDVPATDPGCNADGVCTISPGSALPDITQPLLIDGYSQDGASANTLATGSDAVLKIQLSGEGVGASGIRITGPDSVVRGLIVNGWTANGVIITGAGASGNVIEGNFIGTDASGSQDFGANAADGVEIFEAPDNAVGGTSAGAPNVLSGNGIGVRVQGTGVGSDASGNVIEGNYIGTDASGTQDLGNSGQGVRIDAAPNTAVGGTSARAGNVISANNSDGVVISGTGSSGNRVQGNYIGTDASGQGDLGNGSHGVSIVNTPNNQVGGASAAAANTIANNSGDGIRILAPDATGNPILRNSVFDNEDLGIDLDNDGPTANDPQDPDTGPNNLQNYPAITSATTPDGRSTTIDGTLNSTPNDAFTIQFFSSPAADPSGYGEGKTYLGQTNVLTNTSGNATFSFTNSNTPVRAGQVISATATNSVTKDTSEFSGAAEVEDNTRPTVVSTNPPDRATGVPRAINVTAIFSEQMKASTINSDTFKLFEREGTTQTRVAAAVGYSPPNRRATLNPNANLTPGARYVAQVTTGVQDLAGNHLAQRKTFVFTINQP